MKNFKIDVDIKTTAPKTSTARVAKMRAEAKRKGWKRREYYATGPEHVRLKSTLAELRRDKTTTY